MQKPNILTITKAAKAVNIIYRCLQAKNAKAYRNIRTRALTGADRHYFTADPEKELARSLHEWRAVCTQTCDRVIVGAFEGKNLVGIMSAMHREEDAPDTIYYGSTYVLPEFRNGDVAKKLVANRDRWSKDRGYTRAVFTIREGNEWLNKQICYGAVIRKKEIIQFADGSKSPIYLLERPLFNKGLDASTLNDPCRLAS